MVTAMKLPSLYGSILFASAAFLPGLLRAQVTVGTPVDSDTSAYSILSETYGETFLAPTTATKLTSITTSLAGSGSNATVTAYLFAWNGTTLGAAEGTSTVTVSLAAAADYTFGFTGVNLAAGSDNVVLFESPSPAAVYAAPDSYANGELIQSTSSGAPTAASQFSSYAASDLDFQATFSTALNRNGVVLPNGVITPVPEARTMIFAGLALCAALALASSRRTPYTA